MCERLELATMSMITLVSTSEQLTVSDLRGNQQPAAFQEARQAPKRDARVILLSLPCSQRVPPLISRLIAHPLT